jgi:toxin HigB-1
MIQEFHDQATEDLFNGESTKKARKRLPIELWEVTYEKLDLLSAAGSLDDLRIPRGNRLEKLRGDREGQHSIRINDQYRICFVWTPAGPSQVEVTDYH